MGVKFFGQFLLERQIISGEQLLEAIEYQQTRNLRLGDYAVVSGYMSRADADRVHAEQRSTDRMFGELAVELGIVAPAQMQELLTRQRSDHLYIGEALVDKAFLTRDQLERALAEFHESQREYEVNEVPLPLGLKHPEVIRISIELTQKLLRRVAALEVKPGPAPDVDCSDYLPFAAVCVEFSGALRYRYFLSAPEAVAREVASRLFGEEDLPAESPEMIVEGVKEFCNIVCGNIMGKLAQVGKVVDISPPLAADASLYAHTDGVRVPLVSPLGQLQLAIVGG